MRARVQRRPGYLRAAAVAVAAAGLVVVLGEVAAYVTSRDTSGTLLVGDGAAPVHPWPLAGPGGAAAFGGGASPPSSFSISGSVVGLYPGDVAPLILIVHNAENFPITVLSVQTAVGPSAHCSSSYASVGDFGGRLNVEPKSAATLTVRVTLERSAPDSCQGARFPFRYVGLAVRP